MSHDVETVEHTLAYQLGMMTAYKVVLEALASRSMAHHKVQNSVSAAECLLIANEVIKPLWLDTSREASGLPVAGLEHQA